MLVRPVQPSKAPYDIDVTLPSLGITLELHPITSALFWVSIIQFPALWYVLLAPLTDNCVRLVHPANAVLSNEETLPGIDMLVRPVQFSKARLSIVFTPFEMVTLFSPVHPLNASSHIVSTLLGITILVRPVQY